MSQRNSRYKQMEQYMTYALIFAALLFVVFLICAGAGVIWAKAVTAVLSILICAVCLAFLYMNHELLRTRSLWMTVAAVAIITCTIFSLILGFPSPNPLK